MGRPDVNLRREWAALAIVLAALALLSVQPMQLMARYLQRVEARGACRGFWTEGPNTWTCYSQMQYAPSDYDAP